MVRGLALVVATLGMHCGSGGTPPPSPPRAASAPAPAVEAPALRLPRTFLPASYRARLVIDPARTHFTGAIEIPGALSARTDVIWLHGRKLAVSRAVARPASGAAIPLTVAPRGEHLLELRAPSPLAPGAWTLALDYTGEFELTETAGAFKQSTGGASYIYTHLWPIHARRVFPSFDEPSLKVPWQLTLDVPAPLVAVANAPQASETALAGGMKRVAFAPSKPLPSYLVAFGVGPFELVAAGTSTHGTPVRIVTPAHRGADAAFAASAAVAVLEADEAWFGTPYPYEKLDLLAIPITVGFGAMENAGLITFSERSLLHGDPARVSQAQRRQFLRLAAHEIAHQWFGNLVTPEFWDDLWLNEGFATWLEDKVVAKLEPSWREEQNALDIRNGALALDARVSAHRVRQPIATTDDIVSALSGITYTKGMSVVRMFEEYLGPEVFQRGVREHLAARAWGSATSADFVAAIARASGKSLAAAFATFLDQPGAPEITATVQCASGAASVALAQQRYVPPGSAAPPATSWIVPVCVAYERGGARAEACTLLDGPAATLALPGASCRGRPPWVMPNVRGAGYYRNAYTRDQIVALRDQAWGKLDWLERRAIAFDVDAAAATGKLPLGLALSLVPKLAAGNDRFTLPPALQMMTGLDELVPDDLRGAFEHQLRRAFGVRAAAAGLLPQPAESIDAEATRASLIDAVAWLGRDPALIKAARSLAARWRELPPAIRARALAIAVDADPALFLQILREYRTEPVRALRDAMLFALARVRDVERQRKVLALTLDPALDLRVTQEVLFLASTDATRRAAAQFFRDHDAALFERLSRDENTLQLAAVLTRVCAAGQRDEIAAYLTAKFGRLPGAALLVKQRLEALDQCIARRALLEPELRAWLTPGARTPAARGPSSS